MSASKFKNVLGGLNLQFIAYFLLFAYLPLLTFSVIGYHLNKRIIRQVHEQNLQILARKTSRNLLDVLEQKGNVVRQLIATKPIKLNPQLVPEISTVIIIKAGSFVTVRGAGKAMGPQLIQKDASGSRFCLDTSGERLFFRSTLDSVSSIWSALPLQYIRRLLPSEDPHTHFSVRSRKNSQTEAIEGPVGKTAQPGGQSLLAVFRDDTTMHYDVLISDEWLMRVSRSAMGIYGELDTFLREIILANLIVGVLMFAIAVLLARRIASPIQQLVKAAGKFSEGDLRAPVEVQGSEEVNILAREFEVMRRQLLESYSTLEDKIEERTRALREAQFQISHQEKMASLGLLAAGVAHEIGNPLTGISSMTQIIKRKTGDAEIKEYTSTILENINRISRIVRELVDFTRPSSYEATDVDANTVIKSAIGIVRYDKRAKSISLDMDLQDPLPRLHLVEDQLLQVFINILINAIDACPGDTGHLDIRSFSDQTSVHLHFTDNGIGIPDEDQIKIFEPFFTTKKVGKGTGLGLSVSYGIIKNWNGRISVESKVGQGSTFKIEIPIKQAETTHEG